MEIGNASIAQRASNIIKHWFEHQNKRPCNKNAYLKNAMVFDVIKRRTFHKYGISFCGIVVSNTFFHCILVYILMKLLLYQIGAHQ
jgi:hypothetical protein